MRRRQFLVQGSRTALGFSLLQFAGCANWSNGSEKGANTPLRKTLVPQLETQIPQWLEEAQVPGFFIVIIEGGRLAWRRACGVKDRTTSERIDTDTMFEAQSMSKPVFAYLVMKLCEKGLLTLDTPLTQYTWQRFVEGDPRLNLITARQVLSHTAGFQDWRSVTEPLRIRFTPGERFLYSGEGYYYLQTIVTQLTGHVNPNDCARFEAGLEVCATDFDAYMKRHLLRPFGMRSSTYLWNDTCVRRMARPHDENGKTLDNQKSTAPAVARYGSAGALLTTPAEYAKFVLEIIEPKPTDAFRLTGANVKEMLRPQVKVEGGRYPASWALGWQIFRNLDRDFIYHSGDNMGFHCCAVASAETKRGFVAMTNGDNGSQVLKRLITSERMQRFLATFGNRPHA